MNTMHHFLRLILVMACAFSVSLSFARNDNKARVYDMTVESVVNPLGVDTRSPRLGWRLEYDGEKRGVCQKAYQIEVTDENGEVVWNSGRVKSDASQYILYGGEPLKPESRYDWTVKVWDNKGDKLVGKSWFETSLMTSDGKAGWNGACWIGGGDEDMVLYAHYLPVFRMDLSFKMNPDAVSKKIGFVYGGNDERLMDANKNLFHLKSDRNRSFVKVEVDMSPLYTGGSAVLNVFRVGYHPDDKADKPLASFTLPAELVNRKNACQEHNITLYSNLGTTDFYIAGKKIGWCNVNPLGRGGDFIAFPVVGDVGFALENKSDFADASICIRNFRSPENQLTKVCMDAEQLAQADRGMYLIDPSRNSMPMLRSVFRVADKKIRKARLYATARGVYEMYINGQRVGEDYFNPGCTQYNKTYLYQIYDVTSLLSSGNNAIGAWLGEGWWSGASTYSGEHWNFFGDRQSLLAQLVITYEDGEQLRVVTSPETWKYYSDGPVVYGSFFQGEVYDASKENAVEGWSTAGYDEAAWHRAVEVGIENHVSHAYNSTEPRVDDYSEYQLTAQYGRNVAPVRKLTAQSVEEVRPGVYVYDMGQNMVGVPEIVLDGMGAGKEINLRYAEVKYPNLPRYAGNEGMIMLENIRAAMAQDKYVTKGGHETIAPRFTYHGYRYLEITGIDAPLPIESVRGVVLSSIGELASSYETSNPKVNRLWKNIVWSAYANFFSIPTDCPQRNERLGWAGDISVFSRTATYLDDVSQFLRRYVRAMRDVQRSDGRFPDVAPLGGGFGGLLWGSAGIVVPWEVFQQYGDTLILTEHYDAMRRYIDFVQKNYIDPSTGILVQTRAWGDLGDWLGPEDNKNDKTLMWEAYFLYDLEIMSKVASVLGEDEDVAMYKELYDTRLKHFRDTYIDSETGKTVSSGANGPAKGQLVDIQTSYVLPWAFGLVSDEVKERFASNMLNSVSRPNVADDGTACPPYSLMTGFIGTSWISKALSDAGRDDAAYRLLLQTSYPSWLYSVEQGATTIWERLNSYTHTDGFGENNRMNSFNHYSFGAVGAWMYAYSLGIMRDEEHPGFKRFILRPRIDPTGGMTYAEGHYDSRYGRIESGWKVAGDGVDYEFAVPANTSATLFLPASSADDVTESGLSLKKCKGVSSLVLEDGFVKLELGSGKYKFHVRNS